MGVPECSAHAIALDRVTVLINDERAARDLQRYLNSYAGANFDQLVDTSVRDELTSRDFLAVRKLSVSVLRSARVALRGEALPEVRCLLRTIPGDIDIWEISPGDYDAT